MNHFNHQARQTQAWNNTNPIVSGDQHTALQSGVKQYLENFRNQDFTKLLGNKAFNSDSIFIIGATPGDSLIVTGNWLCTVDILVFGDGILRFKNANATLLGNVYVWGDKAEITADSSTLYIPQLYFYQRSLVAAGAGKLKFTNVTLDFSGLSHNIVATDSSTIDFSNVKKIGFSTNGVTGKAQYIIRGTNLAGEFVIGDQCQLDFKNAKTVLLWHEVLQDGFFHGSFPPAGSVPSYIFDPQMPGVANIDYTIKLENCTDVMWALMPSDGSDVEIADSEIRAIGLWFLAPDSVIVKGLVNNSDYTDFTASLTDRNLKLRNSSVQTWSLYPMRKSKIGVSGCIVGEIGSMGTSQATTSSIFVDGSGGYMWASDTSFSVAVSTPLTTHVRSERNGIMIYAYSPLNLGTATALGNSTLMAIQSSLPEEPVAYDNASVWNVNILQPSSGNTNSIIPISGYALIDRTASSINSEMAWYRLYYSEQGNDSLIAITPEITLEKRNETLAEWDTEGLKPGQYLLHLFVSDDSPTPVIIEAVRAFSLNPGVFGIESINNAVIKVYPNPASDILRIEMPWRTSKATIFNSQGAIAWDGTLDNNITELNISDYPAGMYFIKSFSSNEISVTKFIKR